MVEWPGALCRPGAGIALERSVDFASRISDIAVRRCGARSTADPRVAESRRNVVAIRPARRASRTRARARAL